MENGPSPPRQAPTALPSIINNLKGNVFAINLTTLLFYCWWGLKSLFGSAFEINKSRVNFCYSLAVKTNIYSSAICELLKSAQLSSSLDLQDKTITPSTHTLTHPPHPSGTLFRSGYDLIYSVFHNFHKT